MAIELCVETITGMGMHVAQTGGAASATRASLVRPARSTERCLHDVVAGLPLRFRTPLLLVDRDGRTYTQVSADLGIPRWLVRRRLHTARRRVARQLP